jgi:hypothetical protein
LTCFSEVIQTDREFCPRDSEEVFELLTCSTVYAFDKRQEPLPTAGIVSGRGNYVRKERNSDPMPSANIEETGGKL